MKHPDCHTPTPCPLLLKSGTCGHQVFYGMEACWRRGGRPERKAGLQDNKIINGRHYAHLGR